MRQSGPTNSQTFPHRRRWLALLTLGLALGTAATGVEEPVRQPNEEPPTYKKCVVVEFHTDINPLSEQYLYRKLDEAVADGADLIIVEIESPGGHLDSSQNIARRLHDLEQAHTIAYIPRQALSGAALMSLGCDEIIMASDAVIGDVGVIFQDEDSLIRYAPEKFRTPLVRQMRDLATAKGRPPALFEAMVDMDLVVHQVRNTETGEETCMSDDEIQSTENPDVWEKIRPVRESRKGYFLEVNGARAAELALADGTAESLDEVTSRLGYEGPVRRLRPTAVDTTVAILNWPIITGLLFVIGLVALYVEFSVPGISVGGLIAGLCFLLFFWSRFLGGTAGWLEVVLFAAGIIFLLVEMFVLPGFGISGLTGILLIMASVLLACQGFVIPNQEEQFNVMLNNLLVIAVSGVLVFVMASQISRHLGSIPIFNRIMLPPPESATAGLESQAPSDPASPAPLQAGDLGRAESQLRPAGKARFGSRYVDCMTDGEFLDDGTPLRIVEVSGNRIVVAKAEPESQA